MIRLSDELTFRVLVVL